MVAGRESQRVLAQKGVIGTGSCPQEACTAVARATGCLPRARRRAHLTATVTVKPVTAAPAPGETKNIRLPLTGRQLKSVSAAIKAHRRPRFTVSIEARDPAGNAVIRTVAATARR